MRGLVGGRAVIVSMGLVHDTSVEWIYSDTLIDIHSTPEIPTSTCVCLRAGFWDRRRTRCDHVPCAMLPTREEIGVYISPKT
jgi:hypothetical protein